MKKIILLFLLFFFTIQAFPEKSTLKFNPWELIIYRPENSEDLNQIRCFLKIQDENGYDALCEVGEKTIRHKRKRE